MNHRNLQPHPLASVVPPMSETDYATLVEDIRRNGVREPIVLFEGAILDGRHRNSAASELGVRCQTTEFKGTPTQAEAFVYSMNIARRHMAPKQLRAFVIRAAELFPHESNPSIAKRTGVHVDVVRRARNKTAGQVRTERIADAIAADPAASSRAIAKKAGVHKDTVLRRRGGAKPANAVLAPRKPRKPKESAKDRKYREAQERDLAKTRAAGWSLLLSRCTALVAMLEIATEFTPDETAALKDLKLRLNRLETL